MRRRDPRHPIHKCSGCIYNLKTTCALYEDPKAQWDRRDCSGHNNVALLDRLETDQPEVGAALRKRLRQEEARQRHTEDHHEGNSPQVARGIRSRHRGGTRTTAAAALPAAGGDSGRARSRRSARRP